MATSAASVEVRSATVGSDQAGASAPFIVVFILGVSLMLQWELQAAQRQTYFQDGPHINISSCSASVEGDRRFGILRSSSFAG